MLAKQIDDRFSRAREIILKCKVCLVITGMVNQAYWPKNGSHICLYRYAIILYAPKVKWGMADLGMLVAGDVLIVISNSGKSDEIMMLMPLIKYLGVPLITISGDERGPMPQNADVALTLGNIQEACPLGLAPTSSTTATLALGDVFLLFALLDARRVYFR